MPGYNYYILSGLSYNMDIGSDFDIAKNVESYTIVNSQAMNYA
jgi:hypothetical protein